MIEQMPTGPVPASEFPMPPAEQFSYEGSVYSTCYVSGVASTLKFKRIRTVRLYLTEDQKLLVLAREQETKRFGNKLLSDVVEVLYHGQNVNAALKTLQAQHVAADQGQWSIATLGRGLHAPFTLKDITDWLDWMGRERDKEQRIQQKGLIVERSALTDTQRRALAAAEVTLRFVEDPEAEMADLEVALNQALGLAPDRQLVLAVGE